ncbi:hypothetical protein CHM34_07495 [Paludifilum halophilum]|uniref:Uncharacterized protein n=2 Tax=Paludifilum halophilum TaxID=1642702 RepID=A0A235B7A6_9BACL|nr:hypothetical protein CHM34_07495 [Paludifilum halophilum]
MDRSLPPDSSRHWEEIPFVRWWNRGKRIARWILITLLATAAMALITILYLQSKPLPPPEIRMTSQIYDIRGQVIDHLDKGEHREPVRLDQVSDSLIDATLAVEDRRFYEHWGFSPRGILRAAWANLKSGQVTQGASTITQQLARNLYLTHDRTFSRKLKEAALTAQLELHYSKDEILEMYLNKIYYGNGAYGAERAAQTYFGKKAGDLTLAESAMLAGIPRGPKWYSPLENPRRASKRQHAILDQMVQSGAITEKEATKAKQQTLVYAKPPEPTPAKAPYFRDYVVQTAISQFGLDEAQVRSGGLNIYTTLDLEMQKKAKQAFDQYLGDQGSLQGALISIQPGTGQIRAMVGGKDYSRSQYNRVFGKRQPGSTFKPILYLTALERGFTPITRFESKPTAFRYEGGVYRPTNYHNRYANRLITMEEALATSDNIYAVHTHLSLGEKAVVKTAKRMGMKSRLKAVPSLALGSSAVSPYEMAQVYTTLAAGGVYHPPTAILRIEDADGNLVAQSRSRAVQAVPRPAAFVLTHMLRKVFSPEGTASRIQQMLPRPAAGKTGSTDWDSWLSGYTPDLATTVWIGYDRARPLPRGTSRQTHNIWGTYMREALKGSPPRTFSPPKGVVSVKVDPETESLATNSCPHSVKTYFIRGTEPTQACSLHPAKPEQPSKSPSLWERIKKWWSG